MAGLCDEARALLCSADVVVGGARHLELVRELIDPAACHPALVAGSGFKTNDCDFSSRPRNKCGVTVSIWQSPIEKTISQILAFRPASKVCVLASGDPFHYGIGATLARHIPIEEMRVIPTPSSFSLAAARLGWALQDTKTIGLNSSELGRTVETLIPHLQPNAKIIALSADEKTPLQIASLLTKHGFASAKMWVMEHLGGDKEKIIELLPADAEKSGQDFAKLNLVALHIPADLAAAAMSLTSGRADEWFEHDGQMTKSEIRAITLAALAPRRGELLWDIGLGAGSVAIEWLLASDSNRAIGFEKNPERAARAARNAMRFGVPSLRIMEGKVPEILAGAENPDAIFIGGGGSNSRVIETAWSALKNGGRLVANAVTLETQNALAAAHKKYGGEIISISIEHSEPVGGFTGMRPAMRVVQWRVKKCE